VASKAAYEHLGLMGFYTEPDEKSGGNGGTGAFGRGNSVTGGSGQGNDASGGEQLRMDF
jgi:hypothetical protein